MRLINCFLIIIFLTACSEAPTPELPLYLQNVACNTGHKSDENHTLLDYGSRQVYALCIKDNMLNKKQWLKCENNLLYDPSSRICDDTKIRFAQSFSHTADSRILQGSFLVNGQARDANTLSTADIWVSKIPPASLKRIDPDSPRYSNGFILKGIDLPGKFKLINIIACDRTVNSLESSICHTYLASNDLTIQLMIYIRGKEGQHIENKKFKDELNFWLHFLDKLIIKNP